MTAGETTFVSYGVFIHNFQTQIVLNYVKVKCQKLIQIRLPFLYEHTKKVLDFATELALSKRLFPQSVYIYYLNTLRNNKTPTSNEVQFILRLKLLLKCNKTAIKSHFRHLGLPAV